MAHSHALPPLRDLLQTHGLFAKKSFGQHFLLDENLLDHIAAYAGDLAGFHVVEIGPGPGGLTRALLARGATLTVIERDPRFLPLLQILASAYPNRLTVIEADALKVDVLDTVQAPRKIVANLPYNVGTAMLVNWLEQVVRHGSNAFERLTLMFQKEVADRIMAEPGSKAYGRLAVFAQWLCEMEWHRDIPPGAFSPPPKVASSVISLVPLEKPRFPANYPALEQVVATSFNQRRKMLRAALKPLGVSAEALLNDADIDGTRRAETLSVEEFCRLANAYERQKD